MTQTSSRQCPFCHTSLTHYMTSQYTGCGVVNYPFSLLRCPNCDLYAVDPMPSNATYPVSRTAENTYVPHTLEGTFEWNLPLLRNVKKHVRGGNLLDIGCNAGDFMAIAEKDGFHCTGVEIDEVASRAGQELGRNITQGDFLNMSFDKKFDAIVMNHTLEHIPDFHGLPKKIAQVMTDDGVAVINVPYFHSWLGQLLKQKWSQMAPFTHVWFYSKQNILTLFQPYFESVEMFTNSSCEPHTVRAASWKPLVKGLVIRAFRFLGHGDELRVILKKPKNV